MVTITTTSTQSHDVALLHSLPTVFITFRAAII